MSDSLNYPIVGVAGMSHLGLVSAATFAAKGFTTVCYDTNTALIHDLQQRKWPVEEPELDSLLKNHAQRMAFTAAIGNLKNCDVIYIALDVVTNDTNESDLTFIQALIDEVADIMDDGTLVVVLSQVAPGFMRQLPIPHQQLFYQVETLIFGQAVHRALHPERYIIGCAEVHVPLPKALETLLKAFHCPILPMRYESAELAKMAINLFLASSVTTTNILAEVAAKVGANWNEIVPTLKLDKRIGPHAYLQPGLGIAGGNIERDLASIIKLGDRFGTNTEVVQAWCENSEYQKNWIYRCLQDNIFARQQNPRMTLLGLAYKANTHSVKNAPSLQLLPKLKGHVVTVHDPIVNGRHLADFVNVAPNLLDALDQADVVIILTPWADYARLSAKTLKEKMHGRWIIDPFQVLNQSEFEKEGFHIFTLGRGSSVSHKVEEYA